MKHINVLHFGGVGGNASPLQSSSQFSSQKKYRKSKEGYGTRVSIF
jgi:hypothetical protein